MRKSMLERINLNKVSGYAIVANALQIAFAAAILCYALFMPNFSLSGSAEKVAVAVMTAIVIWGAVMDIREAKTARKIAMQSEMIQETMEELEKLNGTLRAQRHDFKNHLQVVFSLMEMEEYKAAQEYINDVYQSIQRVSETLKTALPAVNALIAAKRADCKSRGIQLEVNVLSSWQDISMPSWELCRALGNLIDNGVDAMTGEDGILGGHMSLEIGENVQAYTFSVLNNGPDIPSDRLDSIFQMGYTTKSAGRGMGLYIVSELIREAGGGIRVESGGGRTCFSGWVPKKARPGAEED